SCREPVPLRQGTIASLSGHWLPLAYCPFPKINGESICQHMGGEKGTFMFNFRLLFRDQKNMQILNMPAPSSPRRCAAGARRGCVDRVGATRRGGREGLQFPCR